MSRPLMATKMYVPKPRPGLVARPRLLESLARGPAVRLALVAAPPGFGKTTLLATWADALAADGRLVAWVALDPADSDPATFWSYLLAAIGAKVPAVGAAGQLWAADAQVPTTELITVLLNELAEVADELWLVLDDYHLVESSEVHAGLEYLLEHLPPQVHVVIGTRVDPDLPLSRWRVRGELVEVRAADLRFTGDEGAAYLRAATGLELDAGDAARLSERTEGWIAALQLAAISLRGRSDIHGFVERFAGDDHYIVDYLMDEVLAGQTGETRNFLLLTSPLDTLGAELCDAVTGLDNGAAILSALDRANLFVVPLDDQQAWFRYHHLFADALRTRLVAELPAQVPLVHRRASEWFEAHGRSGEAIRHALAAADYATASRLVELAVPEARRHRQDAMLAGWLHALPNDAIARSPVLSVFHGWTLLAGGDLAVVEARLDHAERLLARAPGGAQPWVDTTELRTLPATIAIYRSALAQARGDMAAVATHARHALDVIGPDDHLARGGASGFLALAEWSRGDVTAAVASFTGAIRSLRAGGNAVDELSSTALLAEMWMVAGRDAKAAELCRHALSAAETLGSPAARAIVDLHVRLAELDLVAGRATAAGEHLDAAATLTEHDPTSEGRYRWFVASALLAAAQGRHDDAVALLDEAETRYVPGYYPNVRPIAAVRARVCIEAGDLLRAQEWLLDSGVAVTDEVSYLREYEHLTLVRLLLAGSPVDPSSVDASIPLLRRLERAAVDSGRGGSLREVRALLVLAGENLPPVRRGEPGRAIVPAAGALSERELQVLRLLDSELSGPEIARQLFVSHNTLRTHTKHIFTKLDVSTRRAAVARARESGLL